RSSVSLESERGRSCATPSPTCGRRSTGRAAAMRLTPRFAAKPYRRCATATMAPGSTAARVSPSQGGAHMFTTIIWATDGSENADRALVLAKELAQESGCALVAVHSKELLTGRVGGFPLLADEDDIEVKIGRQLEELRDAGINARAIFAGGRAGHAAQTVAE